MFYIHPEDAPFVFNENMWEHRQTMARIKEYLNLAIQASSVYSNELAQWPKHVELARQVWTMLIERWQIVTNGNDTWTKTRDLDELYKMVIHDVDPGVVESRQAKRLLRGDPLKRTVLLHLKRGGNEWVKPSGAPLVARVWSNDNHFRARVGDLVLAPMEQGDRNQCGWPAWVLRVHGEFVDVAFEHDGTVAYNVKPKRMLDCLAHPKLNFTHIDFRVLVVGFCLFFCPLIKLVTRPVVHVTNSGFFLKFIFRLREAKCPLGN